MALGRTQFEKLVKRKMETGKIDRIKLIGQVMSYYKEGINVMTPDFKVYLSWACALGMCSSNGNPVYCRELLNAIKTNMENSEASAQTVSAATWTADEFDSIWDNSGMMNLNLSGALTREYKEAVKGAKEAEDALTNSDDLFRQAAENSQTVNTSEANSGDDADLLNYYEENEDGYDEADYEDIEGGTEEAEYDYEAEYGEAEEAEAETQTEITVEDNADASKTDDAEQFKKEDDLLNALLDNFAVKGCIAKTLKAVIDTLYELYSPNLSGIPHEGLFMPAKNGGSPLWSFKASTGDVVNKPEQVYDSGTQLDVTICNVIGQAAGCIYNYLAPDRETGFPTLENLGKCPYMLEAQLMFQSANIRLSGHLAKKNSIRHWNTLTKAGADVESSRLDKLSDYRKWLTWVINRQYARYIVEAIGAEEIKQYMDKPEAMLSIGDRLDKIASQFNAALRNVIVVRERRRNDKDDMETTSIATIIPSIDPVRIAEWLVQEGVLNASGSTQVKAKGSIVNDIKSIKIAYDGKFVATNIYSGEIADRLIRAGIRSRWDKVLLGMNDNGDMVYRNFKEGNGNADVSQYIYSIYGGSGSGKGNMTLSLLSAALIDNCRVFYVDGKPDSGYALGLQAWKRNREAFMFDGQPKVVDTQVSKGSNVQFEEMPYVNRVRNIARKEISIDQIPGDIFVGDRSARMSQTAKLLGVTRYIRGIEFWRKSVGLNDNRDDWAVYVFDELTSMSDNELTVRNRFYDRAKALLERKGLTDKVLRTNTASLDGNMVTVLKEISLDEIKSKDREAYSEALHSDESLYYIYKWCKWANHVVDNLGEMINIAIRKACATTFIIFQNAQWLSRCGSDRESYTTIRAFAYGIGPYSTKFVGRNALANNCGNYGTATEKKATWYTDYINPEGMGNWAMCSSPQLSANSDTITIFKPFSCWGYILSLEETRIAEGTPHKERYFEYNIDKLAGAFGVDVGAALQRAYDWANAALDGSIKVDLVQTEESASTVEKFIYNASNFASIENEEETGAVSSIGESGSSEVTNVNRPNFESLGDDETQIPADMPIGEAVEDAGTPSTGEQAFGGVDYDSLFNEGTYGTSPSVNIGEAVVADDIDAVPVDIDTNVAVARASQATATRGEGSNTTIDLSNTEKSTSAARLIQGKDGNSIYALSRLGNYSQKQFAAIMDNPKKYNKFLDAEFNGIIDAIIKERGGRMAVRILELDSNKLLVDTKLVVMADTFECMGPDFMLELVSYPDIFGSFPKLTLLILDTAMFGLFEEQIEPLISDADIANGDDNAARYVLRHNASLNTIRVKGAGEYKKADLLAKDRQEAMKLRRERIANKAERSLKSRLNKVKSDRKMPTAPKRTFDGKAAVRKIAGKSVRGVGLLFRGIGKAIAFLARHSH